MDSPQDQGQWTNDYNGFRSFDVAGLASDKLPSNPTGMKDEILLLSWLIVLLKTREGGRIRYEWAFKGYEHAPETKSMVMEEVMPGLTSTVGEVATAISSSITTVTSTSRPVTVILSTSSLSQTSEEAKDEGILHLEVRFSDGCVEISPIWQTENMLPFTTTHYIKTLVDTASMCISNPDASIAECMRPTVSDLDAIWGWNHDLPPSYDFCMHEMVSERAQSFPDKVAISSWDGDLTYGQIEQYSNFVACSLRDMGVELHDFLPVCFEKSRWTIVAVLAVMKVGGTFVLMDPTLPLARLQNMAKQVNAKTMLSSRKQYDFSTSVLSQGKFIVVEADTFAHLSTSQSFPKLPTVPSSALMYLIFTSGSTGTPKGVKISHGTYTSSAIPRAKAVGYTEESRVLDFASYAFDVSIDSMLLTLGNGGCLCIPSDEDRLNDINGVIRNMRVNYAGITPSVARILDEDVISSLHGLGLGGEAASARDVTIWGQDTRIIIGYGPCECTIGCTVNSSAATGRDYISIGPGNGAAIWIVNPDDHESLLPVGAVGELLVEGPIVGQGYLDDPDKTAAAFIEDPLWLTSGHRAYGGRRGRLYKTGDLGKYDPDGSAGIVFAGRKDTQVKLRGQRVELGEIESQLRARLPSDTNVIAEVIVPLGQPTLVAFIASQSTKRHDTTNISAVELPAELRNTLATANTDLAKVLPRYMVPTAYIPVNNIPVLISGKTDRKRLREFGVTVNLRQLDLDNTSTALRELTELEQRLRQAWSQTLNVDPEGIRLDDNFFALGGDSLMAMRLVTVCRAQSLDLSVTSTFGHPTLSAMADVVKVCDSQSQEATPTFSLISQDVDSACLEASEACGTVQTDIENIYPCTPTQESLFTFSLKSTKAYVAQRVACVPSHFSLDAWKQAWDAVVAAIPILRTRVAQLQEPGLQQVVLKGTILWQRSTDLEQYLEDDRKEKMDLGQSLARYAIVDNLKDGKTYMVWTVHHVLYDGWSEPLILQQVSNVLQNHSIETQAFMGDFVKYVCDTDEAAMEEYWRHELRGADGPQFPRLPSRDYLPVPDAMVERQINLQTSAGSPFTMATLIRGAWALVSSQYTGSEDVVFGETLAGRDIPLPGVEGIVGPLIATLPVRVHVNQVSTVGSYLQAVQQSMLDRIPYQHMGMQYIRKVSRDAQHACEAGTGLVFQPEPEYVGGDLGFQLGDVVREALHFNPYPLMLACGIRKGGFRVCASFDSGLIEVAQMERILAQLEMACSQLAQGVSKHLSDITCMPEAELNQVWHWNQTPPLALDASSWRLRADASVKQGSVYPQAVVPWVCDTRNASLLSPIGCVGELWLEGTFLPGETYDSPAWLLAGSPSCAGRSGRVQPTGDMVKLREDGRLIFICQKDSLLPVQGHAVDIGELETHLSKQLPPETRAAATVFQSSSGSQEVIVFIEQQASEGDQIEIMDSSRDVLETTICAKISVSLAVALKKLDKFIRDSLSPYMVPSAYVVVEKIPALSYSSQLASEIPQDVLYKLRQGMNDAWTNSSTQTHLTASEHILRSSWAKILRTSEEKIDVDDNFFRLGGDSVLAMKLVSNLRVQGHALSVADIFQHMRLGDAAKVLKLDQVPKGQAAPCKPFSTLGDLKKESFLTDIVRPRLADPSWPVQDTCPVTDSQSLDIRATIRAPRTSVQYTLLYFGADVDRDQLLRACKDLVKTHDILRTIFVERDMTFLQVVLSELDVPVTMRQADKKLEEYVIGICAENIDSDFCLGSSFLKLFHVQGEDGQQCLIIGLSHAQYDGISLPRMLRDLETLYTGQKIVDHDTYPSYIARVQNVSAQKKALGYWRNLLSGSSLSLLDGVLGQAEDKAIFREKPVDVSNLVEDITKANLLTAAWALVLARRLRRSDVTFGSVTSGRNIDSATAENVIGPCYQFTPVRVTFEPQWTPIDLLQFVQRQTAESAAYDFLGFEKISKQCTQWAAETQFFDSLVHHQDEIEEVDTMPFAGGSCRVDIQNPHGDAAHPLKIVSYVRGGQTRVGVVGTERDAAFVDAALDELAATVEELTVRCTGNLLLAN